MLVILKENVFMTKTTSGNFEAKVQSLIKSVRLKD